MSRSGSVSFSDLPLEIVFRIFLLLDVYGLHTVSCLNKTCHAIYKQHLELVFMLKAAGMVNETRTVDSGEKLRALKQREEQWKTLDVSRPVTAQISHHASNLYDLSAGFYILGGLEGNSFFDYFAKKTTYLRFADLSNYEGNVDIDPGVSNGDSDEEDVKVKGLPVPVIAKRKSDGSKWSVVKAANESVIVDFGLCIDEHDLIAMVEAMPSPGAFPVKLALHLHQFSTGAPHPDASKPIIDLGTAQASWGKLSLMVEIVGPYLLLLLNWDTNIGVQNVGVRDRLLLINWISGDILAEEQSPPEVWNGLVFLTPLIFILTNMERRCLDVIHIPQNLPTSTTASASAESSPQQPRTSFVRLMSFMLPETVPEFFYHNISCRADPNHFGVETHGSSSLGTKKGRRALFTNDPEKAIMVFRILLTARPGLIRFSFVVHRSSLLRFVHEAAPWILTDSPPPEDTSNPPTLHWDDWGPASTRWLFDDAFHTPWITTTAGQREVFMRGEPGSIIVRDYNPINIRRAIWESEHGVFNDMDGRRKLVTDSEPMAAWAYAFASNGSHSLPCIEVETEEEYDYDGVLMDENHLLGLERSEISPQLSTFDVFTF